MDSAEIHIISIIGQIKNDKLLIFILILIVVPLCFNKNIDFLNIFVYNLDNVLGERRFKLYGII